jgi:hypothetical protein
VTLFVLDFLALFNPEQRFIDGYQRCIEFIDHPKLAFPSLGGDNGDSKNSEYGQQLHVTLIYIFFGKNQDKKTAFPRRNAVKFGEEMMASGKATKPIIAYSDRGGLSSLDLRYPLINFPSHPAVEVIPRTACFEIFAWYRELLCRVFDDDSDPAMFRSRCLEVLRFVAGQFLHPVYDLSRILMHVDGPCDGVPPSTRFIYYGA